MLSQRDKDKALNFEQLQVALRVAGMDAAKKAQVVAYARAIAALLYAETSSEQLETLEGIETASRGHMQTHVNPEVAIFLSQRVAAQMPDVVAESSAFSES